MTRALVVGAGPTGLTAALTLASHGVEVDLRERNASLSSRSLAATFHPPTLQILSDLGVDLEDAGLVADRIEYRRADRSVTFDLQELAGDTRYPYRRHIPQLEVCQRLLRAVQAHAGTDVQFGIAAAPGMADDYDLVVAADGADSLWRAHADIEMSVEPYEGQVTRLLCPPEEFTQWAPVTYVFTGDDSVSVLRMADHARIILRTGDEEPDLDDLISRARNVLGLNPQVTGWSTYRARRAVCSRNLQENLLVVGDAAHLTNTRGGMNMNAGIHDAAVLCRTFATSPELLGAVAAQRMNVVTGQLLPRTHATLGRDRFETVQAIHSDVFGRHAFMVEASMLDMVHWP